ncbi:inactive ubiquitin carboxyl-terminal hydrolase MINDY-4B-like [Macrosteles quadrilineatus]|uniref:inactive ubiquitin carboxyl-terminal hydrolase MINDY-4B-like n=1 Tax=Macrosteles quadrilineatus TaxID=74068 RepID=UPI0023E26B40|nr:inactive ubiquitin carboxyl-terminal hydrolase MINDY-4B-like isoform X2 [Macrosteles quadrilineatus]XP_054271922.1 inactive ubiquitin carboxyl-terminal hydrolase MINDY-4B-like [Macrosteles quadrilineatus]
MLSCSAESFNLLKTSYLSSYDGYTYRVMYARNQQRSSGRVAVVGGEPINEEMAVALRTVVFGTAVAPPRGEWLRTGFSFREPDKELAYGLKGSRNSTRGLLSAVQAEIIKILLFEKRIENANSVEMFLKPNRSRQLEALIKAMSDILWRVGEKTKAIICLPQDTALVPHSVNFFQDTLTEKLHLFEITNLEDLQIFLKRYIHFFLEETGPGALLLLYSAVATRGTSNCQKDMEVEKAYLVTGAEEGSMCIVTLLLTGRATPYLHNGVVYVGDEEHYAVPQYGILSRSEIGFLFYEEGVEERMPGSRLKTPSLPIWVVCSQGHFGVMFNTNRELLRNYHAERRFELHYYTCGGSQCQMTVDTRQEEPQVNHHTEQEQAAINSFSNIEKLIHTKWQDARIQWHGMSGFI